MERPTGFEPATSSLGSWHSATELRPLDASYITRDAGTTAPPYLIVISVALMRSSLRAFQLIRLLAP
jgi:hypothetical protein